MKIFLMGLFMLSGCELKNLFVTQEFSMDGVKLIEQGEPHNEGQYLQDQYEIMHSKRLLLRFEAFEEHASKVYVDEKRRIWVSVTLKSGEASHLTLCPVTTNWMMAATWTHASMLGDKKWKSEGGDFDAQLCGLGITKAHGQVLFDVTGWYVNYATARKENFGFVLMSSSNAVVLGETNSTHSPRILVDEPR